MRGKRLFEDSDVLCDSVAHRSRRTALGALVKSEVKVSAAARKAKLVLQATVTTAVGGGIWAEQDI